MDTENMNGVESSLSDVSANELKEKIRSLENEVKTFGQKRAYFMEIYKKKEDEASRLQQDLTHLKHINSRLESDLKGIREQVADMKTEHTITCISKDEELEQLKLMHQEELSSLNMSLQELLNDNSERQELRAEINTLKSANRDLSEELTVVKTALKERLKQNQAVYSSEQTKGSSTSCSGKCADEKHALRMQLDVAHQRLQQFADMQTLESRTHAADSDDGDDEVSDSNPALANSKKQRDLFDVVDQEDRIKELEHELQSEKASRRDLEMYVAVLAKQKDVFQSDVDCIRRELGESLALLDKERKEHTNLKETWQMANDQFLESQRLLMIDMKRLESVLTEEQQRRVVELQKQDEEREAQQKKIDDLEKQRQEQIQKLDADQTDSVLLNPAGALIPASSLTSLSSTEMFGEFERADPIETTSPNAISPEGSVDREMTATTADTPPIAVSNVLTEDMQTALVAPLPEDVENKRALDHFKSYTPDRGQSPAGKRLVSEKEWAKLQEQLQVSRSRLGRPCDMCKNYEIELQKEQDTIKSLEAQLAKSRQNVKESKKTAVELENKMKSIGKENQDQLEQMSKSILATDEQIYVLKQNFTEVEQKFQTRLAELAKERDEVQVQLREIESENQQLLNIHSKISEEMIDEQFIQPSNLDTALRLLNELREDVVKSKAAKEHIENKLQSKIQFLNDQANAVELVWQSKEDTMNQEISSLEDKIVRLESMESEMRRESKLRQEVEERLAQYKLDLEAAHVTEGQLKKQVQTLIVDMKQAQERNSQMKDQLKTLQTELTNSESVQKDFVKLSQQLQIQLEKIRQAETEVRWEYEDDVTNCNNCGLSFTSNKDKQHCKHCGKIYCQECLSQSVQAGPKRRTTKVCDVCHTILVNDATPYFSSESKTKT